MANIVSHNTEIEILRLYKLRYPRAAIARLTESSDNETRKIITLGRPRTELERSKSQAMVSGEPLGDPTPEQIEAMTNEFKRLHLERMKAAR